MSHMPTVPSRPVQMRSEDPSPLKSATCVTVQFVLAPITVAVELLERPSMSHTCTLPSALLWNTRSDLPSWLKSPTLMGDSALPMPTSGPRSEIVVPFMSHIDTLPSELRHT